MCIRDRFYTSNTLHQRKYFVLWYLSVIIREDRMSQRPSGRTPTCFNSLICIFMLCVFIQGKTLELHHSVWFAGELVSVCINAMNKLQIDLCLYLRPIATFTCSVKFWNYFICIFLLFQRTAVNKGQTCRETSKLRFRQFALASTFRMGCIPQKWDLGKRTKYKWSPSHLFHKSFPPYIKCWSFSN